MLIDMKRRLRRDEIRKSMHRKQSYKIKKKKDEDIKYD
jgi:hypothetical protein